MLSRRKNLLEAFKRSEAPSAPAPDPAPRAPLFERPVSDPGAARSREGWRPRWALTAIGLVLAFVLGFIAGRESGVGEDAVEAAGDGAERVARGAPPPLAEGRAAPATQPRSFQEPPLAQRADPSAASSSASPRIEDSALFAPENLQTVVVASYTKSNEDLAWATHQHLRDAGLPVFPPVASRNLVVVLAGAAPTSGELEQLASAVRALSRDGKKKDYADAYTARIDTLIPRPKGTQKP
jgi:hypothetical protein